MQQGGAQQSVQQDHGAAGGCGEGNDSRHCLHIGSSMPIGHYQLVLGMDKAGVDDFQVWGLGNPIFAQRHQ